MMASAVQLIELQYGYCKQTQQTSSRHSTRAGCQQQLSGTWHINLVDKQHWACMQHSYGVYKRQHEMSWAKGLFVSTSPAAMMPAVTAQGQWSLHLHCVSTQHIKRAWLCKKGWPLYNMAAGAVSWLVSYRGSCTLG